MSIQMEPTAVTGLQGLRSSKTPPHGDQDIPSTQAPACAEQALPTGNQRYGASPFNSDIRSKAVPPSTQPTIAPKQKPWRFVVTTDPTQFKSKETMRENRKHVMNDFLRKERTRPRDVRAEGPAEVEQPGRLDPYQPKAKTTTNLLQPVRKLDTDAVALARLNVRAHSWIQDWIDESTTDLVGAGKRRVAMESWYPEARSHGPEYEAYLLNKSTGTTAVEHSLPAAIPRLQSSDVSLGINHSETSMNQNEELYQTTQHNELEGCSTQPLDNTTLAYEPIVEQSLATEKGILGLPQLDLQAFSATAVPASQHHVRNNPLQQRLQQLVEYLASERESSPDSTSSVTDSDHSASHTGYHHHNGTLDADSPDSSNNTRSNTQHAFGSTVQTSYNQPCDRSRTTFVPGPTQEYGDNERVQTDTRQTQNDQENGKVIPCPLKVELKCAGMDDNMSSLL
jgi:hypothetical protein